MIDLEEDFLEEDSSEGEDSQGEGEDSPEEEDTVEEEEALLALDCLAEDGAHHQWPYHKDITENW